MQVDLVFPRLNGDYLPPMTLRRHWDDVLIAAKLSRAPFHAARHMASSLMLAALTDPKVAAEQLGHASAAMTLDRHTHLSTGQRTAAAAPVDRFTDEGDPRTQVFSIALRTASTTDEQFTLRDWPPSGPVH